MKVKVVDDISTAGPASITEVEITVMELIENGTKGIFRAHQGSFHDRLDEHEYVAHVSLKGMDYMFLDNLRAPS